jgi:hypothetical protein
MVSPSAGAGDRAIKAVVARRRAELRVDTLATGAGLGPGSRGRECENVVCNGRSQHQDGPGGWHSAITGRRRFLLVCGIDEALETRRPVQLRTAGPHPRMRRNRAHGRNGNTAHHYGINLCAGPADPISAIFGIDSGGSLGSTPVATSPANRISVLDPDLLRPRKAPTRRAAAVGAAGAQGGKARHLSASTAFGWRQSNKSLRTWLDDAGRPKRSP